MIGTTVSHFRVLEKLGEGGMGVVYRAEDLTLHRQVALKFLAPRAIGRQEDRRRLLREAQASAALDHPNICPVYAVEELDGEIFIVMALAEGVNLKRRLCSSSAGRRPRPRPPARGAVRPGSQESRRSRSSPSWT